MTEVWTVTYPEPILTGQPCPTCGGKGITGERYRMETSPDKVMLVDEFCPKCGGCGHGDHDECVPSAHAFDPLDPDGEDDTTRCPSCDNREWWPSQAWSSDGESDLMYTLRVPCGCTEKRAQRIA